MRKLILVAVLAVSFMGCATSTGFMYADMPPRVDGPKGSKTGEATCRKLFAISFGDCSIGGAMAKGNMDSVSTVDYRRKNILWVYRSYTTSVTGE